MPYLEKPTHTFVENCARELPKFCRKMRFPFTQIAPVADARGSHEWQRPVKTVQIVGVTLLTVRNQRLSIFLATGWGAKEGPTQGRSGSDLPALVYPQA